MGDFGFEIRYEDNLDFHFLEAVPEAGAGREPCTTPKLCDLANEHEASPGSYSMVSLSVKSRLGNQTQIPGVVFRSLSVICNHRNRMFLLLFPPCQQFLGG